MKGYVFIEKATNRISLYGSLVAMVNKEEELIGKTAKTFYNTKELKYDDFENEKCIIAFRDMIREKQNPQFL